MPSFPTTRWSLIRAADGLADRPAGAAADAWGELVRDYRPAIVAYFRRGPLARDAEDLAQAFLLRCIDEGWWSRADPATGGFRRFLFVLLKRYATREREAAYRHHETADEAPDRAGPSTPERAFDLDFALCLARNALAALRAEYESDGRGDMFEALQPWLAEALAHGELAALGMHLGVAPNTLAVALKRLRLRYQKAVRAAVAQLSLDAASAEADFADLRAALATADGHA